LINSRKIELVSGENSITSRCLRSCVLFTNLEISREKNQGVELVEVKSNEGVKIDV